MIGWCDDLYADEMAGHGQESDVDYVELLSNMAGNAWSMFHYAPLQVYVFSPNWKLLISSLPPPPQQGARDCIRLDEEDLFLKWKRMLALKSSARSSFSERRRCCHPRGAGCGH